MWSEKTQARREGLVHTLSAHTRDHKHSREWDISVPDAAAGALSGRRNIAGIGSRRERAGKHMWNSGGFEESRAGGP